MEEFPQEVGRLAEARATLERAQQTLSESKNMLLTTEKFTERLFEKGQAYNSAIILAGFGGLFALLAATSQIISTSMLAASAILLGISLVTYVSFVIYNMFIMSLAMFATAKKQLQQAKLLQEQAGVDASDIVKALETLKTNMKIWTFVWIVSVATGLSAGAIMLISYFNTLITQD